MNARWRALALGLLLAGCRRHQKTAPLQVTADSVDARTPDPGEPSVRLFVHDHRVCALAAGKLACASMGQGGTMGTFERLPLDDVRSVSLGGYHACAMTAHGKTFCWGDFAGTESWWDEIAEMPALAGAEQVVVFGERLWARRGTKVVGVAAPSSVFAKPDATVQASFDDTSDLATDGFALCRLKSDATVWCSGRNVNDVLLGRGGITEEVPPESPLHITELGAVRKLSLGDEHACVLLENAEVWCWGSSRGFDPKDTAQVEKPRKIFPRARAVSTGFRFTCVLRVDGSIACFGDAMADRTVDAPIVVEGLHDARSLAVGNDLGCAVDAHDAVFCWFTGDYLAVKKGLVPRLEAKPVSLDAAVPSKLVLAGPHPALPLMRDELHHNVMPLPQDAKCWPDKKLWDPHVGACRWYPGGCYNCSMGCSMGGGGMMGPPQPCITGSRWAGCDCSCKSGAFDGTKRMCVPSSTTP